MAEFTSYLDAPVDYSQSFSDRIARLGAELSTELSHSLSHDDDMNYNAGQKLSLYLTADGRPTDDARAANHALSIWISSKGPFWTAIVHRGPEGELTWYPGSVSAVRETPAGNQILETIDRFMASHDLTLVPEEALGQPAEGHETEMDGAPATVRDVLFCEIC
ncbi:hypothetical protein ETD83_14110 [Actinomadura soli]|uniref:Uncharacterized protein n=1 Tax=Actinomadura soli TaxID=2508997 RepID=A0A5C4JD48_9ACTN|nr:hypothetical protein [Actinomadura soli]TMR01763.1 hypothetical protein ETD83_14110 [Actinomadura soli]